MTAILYIETNFLFSFATGRDKGTDDLIDDLIHPKLTVRLVVPAVCFMEACSTYEVLKTQHEKFVRDLRNKINECERGFAWVNENPRLNVLQQSLREFEAIFLLFRARLDFAFHMLGTEAELIELSRDTLKATSRNRIIEDTTDNLILTNILEHARAHSLEAKSFLTENSKDFHDNLEAQKALRELGIKYFRKGQACLDWLNSLRPPANTQPPQSPQV